MCHALDDVETITSSGSEYTALEEQGSPSPWRRLCDTLVSGELAPGGGATTMEVFRDELNVGLTLREEKVAVRLQPGWNALLLRSCTKWAAPAWGLWAALRHPNGTRPSTLVTSACGPHCGGHVAWGNLAFIKGITSLDYGTQCAFYLTLTIVHM